MDTLAVIGSQPRLEILRLLSQQDRYVSELMDRVGMDGTTATHHLDVLLEAGVIDDYRDGRRRYFTLASEIELEITPSPNRRFVARITDTAPA